MTALIAQKIAKIIKANVLTSKATELLFQIDSGAKFKIAGTKIIISHMYSHKMLPVIQVVFLLITYV
jgi:hypothetical protein